jgi:hypothetical protein
MQHRHRFQIFGTCSFAASRSSAAGTAAKGNSGFKEVPDGPAVAPFCFVREIRNEIGEVAAFDVGATKLKLLPLLWFDAPVTAKTTDISCDQTGDGCKENKKEGKGLHLERFMI